jgi:DNA polymerase I
MRFKYLDDAGDICELIDWHNDHSDIVVLDFETTDKDPRKAQLLEIQMMGREEDEAVMFDGRHLPLLEGVGVTQVFHNFKYDWKVAALHGTDFMTGPREVRDTMLMHHLADENKEHGLDAIVQETYGDDYKAKFWAEFKAYGDAPLERRLDYGCRDIVYTRRLYRTLCDRLHADGVPPSLVEHVHRLALALYRTELQGIKVDLGFTVEMGSALKAQIGTAERELRALGGYHCEAVELDMWAAQINKLYTPKGKKWQTHPKPEFNFAASGQVVTLLYDQLGLPAQIDKKTKRRTADDKALEALEAQHPIVPKLRELRKYSKMYGSFIEGVLDKVQDGRIYPSFNVNGTVTGRISHSEPNMGQMPSKGEWAKIRGIFVPEAGNKLITCDYGQLEVCIEAHFSGDKNLLRILNEGLSKHDITNDELKLGNRGLAKTLNFAMQYRCSVYKVAELVGCSQEEAQGIFDRYWQVYAGVQEVFEECCAKVRKGEHIVNPFGRRRRFPTEFEKPWEREAAYRQAYSSLIQGTGSDITSTAFYRIAEALEQLGWGRAWFTVHDEVIVEVGAAQVPEARELIQKIMVGIGPEIGLTVPLTVDCSEGLDRWVK